MASVKAFLSLFKGGKGLLFILESLVPRLPGSANAMNEQRGLGVEHDGQLPAFVPGQKRDCFKSCMFFKSFRNLIAGYLYQFNITIKLASFHYELILIDLFN